MLEVELPLNTWILLPGRVSPPYRYSAPVYAPSRGQVLHWGRNAAEGWRNDVLAFDVSTMSWVSDGNGAPQKELADAQREGSLLGVSITGTAGMLPSKTPAPSTTAAAGVWDSKRHELVYPLAGMTFAYDPSTHAWRDFKAANTPALYGPGAGYDPINDELVVFPHFGARNHDLATVNGNVTGHLGTHVYSYQENAWRRTTETFGSPAVRAARAALLSVATPLSLATDGAWALRRAGSVATPAQVKQALAEAKTALDSVSIPLELGATLDGVATPLAEASSAAATGNWDATLQAGGRASWALDALLDGPLRVEPQARAGSPLVYLPSKKSLLLFGGHDGLVRQDLKPPENKGGEPGRRNDTWLYDCATRQWREVSKSQRPPATLWPRVVYDPASGLALLVTRTGNPWDPSAAGTASIWGFDPATEEWQKLHEQAWPGSVGGAAYTGWGTVIQEVALDERAGLLLLLQVLSDGTSTWQQTYALKLDVSQLKSSAAPAWTAPGPIRPHGPIPADDPAVVGRLQTLPANSWVHMRPKNESPERQWGIAASDPVRGHVYYFGGGHSTYQVNDVAIYAPGVNAWFYAVGDHNDWIYPASWDGSTLGLRGGRNAHHQRNTYVALDGRMYSSLGAESRRWGAQSATEDRQRYAWFYDVDRGGVWREVPIETSKGPGVTGLYGGTHLATPDGRVLGFGGGLEPYDGRFFPGESYFASLDVARSTLTVQKVAGGPPSDPNEDRPFAFVSDRNQVFFYECVVTNGTIERQHTWVYDLATNAFIDLKPARQPPADAQTVEYLNGQNAIFAVIRGGQQWVYSFARNTWAPLPMASDSPVAFENPYAQTIYSARYGVLVNLGVDGTAVMRPDVAHMTWP